MFVFFVIILFFVNNLLTIKLFSLCFNLLFISKHNFSARFQISYRWIISSFFVLASTISLLRLLISSRVSICRLASVYTPWRRAAEINLYTNWIFYYNFLTSFTHFGSICFDSNKAVIHQPFEMLKFVIYSCSISFTCLVAIH